MIIDIDIDTDTDIHTDIDMTHARLKTKLKKLTWMNPVKPPEQPPSTPFQNNRTKADMDLPHARVNIINVMHRSEQRYMRPPPAPYPLRCR